MAETGLILGHSKPSVLKEHYHTKHLDVGLQSLFNKRRERRGRLQPLASLRTMRFPGAPSDRRGTYLHQEFTGCRNVQRQLSSRLGSRPQARL